MVSRFKRLLELIPALYVKVMSQRDIEDAARQLCSVGA